MFDKDERDGARVAVEADEVKDLVEEEEEASTRSNVSLSRCSFNQLLAFQPIF